MCHWSAYLFIITASISPWREAHSSEPHYQGANCINLFQRLQSKAPSWQGILTRVKSATKTAYNDYVDEAKREGWVRRFFIRNRKSPEKFDHTIWYDPLTAPLYLPAEMLKLKKQLTFPAVLALSAYPTALIFDHFESERLRMLAAAQKDLIGTSYVFQMSDAQVIEQDEIGDLVQAHTEALKKWNQDFTGNTKLPRSEELLHLGVFSDQREMDAVESLARGVFKKVQAQSQLQHQSKTAEGGFEQRLFRAWIEEISASPLLKSKTEQQMALISSIFLPMIPLSTPKGATDLRVSAELLGIHPASPETQPYMGLLDEIGLPASLSLLRQSHESPARVSEKIAQWRRLFPNEAVPDFVRRLDLPGYSGTLAVDGKPLSNEFSIWIMVWQDPRFAPLKAAYQARQINQAQVLKLLKPDST